MHFPQELNPRITLEIGDITQQNVEAVVNAANESLLGGGGVDGAIHRAAGPALLAHNRTLNGCPTGQAVLTPGFQLKARHIIHTVGPVWRGGQQGEADLLRSCYQKCLAIAQTLELASVAFPAISTGVYGYPLEQAATIALKTVSEFLATAHYPQALKLVCFDQVAANVYLDSWLRLQNSSA